MYIKCIKAVVQVFPHRWNSTLGCPIISEWLLCYIFKMQSPFEVQHKKEENQRGSSSRKEKFFYSLPKQVKGNFNGKKIKRFYSPHSVSTILKEGALLLQVSPKKSVFSNVPVNIPFSFCLRCIPFPIVIQIQC